MARELTREEKRKIRALVVKWCANYDKEYGCLPLECECYMFGKCWTGAYCRYFREAVLPLDPALEAALMTEGPPPVFKPCPICGGAVPVDGRMAYLRPDRPAAAKARVYAEKAEVMCGKLGPGKPADYKAFRGRFGGGPYVSMPRPHFSKMLSTSPRCHFWTLCPEVTAYLIMTRRRYSGRKSRLCDPPHDPV